MLPTLENDHLFNMKLFRVDEEKHYLVCNFHHIIFDGVSFVTFFEELGWRFMKEFKQAGLGIFPLWTCNI